MLIDGVSELMYIVIQGELEARIDFSRKVLTEADLKLLETDLDLTKQELHELYKANQVVKEHNEAAARAKIIAIQRAPVAQSRNIREQPKPYSDEMTTNKEGGTSEQSVI